MHELDIPGFSFAIIDDNEVAYARSYGTLAVDEQKPVLTSSPFQLGSLPKYITSLAIHRLVDAGLISHDTNLNEYNNGPVSDWRVMGLLFGDEFNLNIEDFQNPFFDIQVRHLLNHTAHLNLANKTYNPLSLTSLKTNPFWIPTQDTSDFCLSSGNFLIDESEPFGTGITLLDQLLGFECTTPTNCDCGNWNRAHFIRNEQPGQFWHYSNSGYLLLQAVLETETGQPLEQYADQRIFKPLRMYNTFYDRAVLTSYWEKRIAKPHNPNGEKLSRRVVINGAAGGLYSTPENYARAMVVLMNEGHGPNSVGSPEIISNNSVLDITASRNNTDLDEFNVSYGYGVGVKENDVFLHSGGVHGFSSCMEGSLNDRQGIVLVINRAAGGNSNAAVAGRNFIREVLDAYHDAYSNTWGDYPGDHCLYDVGLLNGN